MIAHHKLNIQAASHTLCVLVSETWAKFEQHARMFVGPLSDKTEIQKVSYLLLWIGEKGRKMFSTFHFAPGLAAVAATNDALAAPASIAEDRTILIKYVPSSVSI